MEHQVEKQALIYVDQSLELAEVGKALIADEIEQIEKWMKQESILKLSSFAGGAMAKSESFFQVSIVEPLVLFQLA